jgi:hypothetical protein
MGLLMWNLEKKTMPFTLSLHCLIFSEKKKKSTTRITRKHLVNPNLGIFYEKKIGLQSSEYQ